METRRIETAPQQAAGAGSGIRPRIRQGLVLLLEAYEFAQELERDLWDFAVEAVTLLSAGLTKSDFRWLVCKRYVQHARENTKLGENGREFRPAGDLTFTRRSCFVLTEAGLNAVRAFCERGDSQAAGEQPMTSSPPGAIGPGHERSPVAGSPLVDQRHEVASGNGHHPHLYLKRPTWDGQRHELRVDDKLVKVFKLPSPNQETVLMAFEEEGWPPRIDDPLPPVYEIDPKRRLHDTIKSLNRRQRHRLLRFMGDGTGEGVRWELIPPPRRDDGREQS